MDFVLTGFHQLENVRRFYFDTAGDARTRQRVTVGADLNLIRRYKIPLQELPLLCRRLLEGRAKIEATMLTENDMVQYANAREAAADALMKKRRERHQRAANRFGKSGKTSGNG